MFFSCELPQKFESINIPKLTQDAIKLLGPALKEKNIDVRFRSDKDQFTSEVDGIQLTQVIFNLLINAIHASPDQSVIDVNLQLKKDSFCLLVSDHGCGIPPQIQERIFEPFFTTKPIGKGSGLGLSVVHGIISAHKGSILVASEENKGTSFNIEIPLKQL